MISHSNRPSFCFLAANAERFGVWFLTFAFFLWTLIQVVRNKTPRGWELKYTRISFFPYWRSVLKARSPCKVVRLDDVRTLEWLEKSWGKPVGLGSSPILYPNLGLLGRTDRFSNNHPKRMFCSAALPLLKVFRSAWVEGTPGQELCFLVKIYLLPTKAACRDRNLMMHLKKF